MSNEPGGLKFYQPREFLYSWSKRRIPRSLHATRKGGDHGQIKDIVSIGEHPASVEDRAVPGHWQGDLISGSQNSYIATLVDCQTRYSMLIKMADKETQTVVSALIRQAKKLPAELYKSLTWDRGKELSAHRQFSLATTPAISATAEDCGKR